MCGTDVVKPNLKRSARGGNENYLISKKMNDLLPDDTSYMPDYLDGEEIDLKPKDTSLLPDYLDGETLKPTTTTNRGQEALVLPDWGMGKTCKGESITTDDDEETCTEVWG